jgi:ribosome maturation factor RimP
MTATLFSCSRKAPVQLRIGRFLHSWGMDNTTKLAPAANEKVLDIVRTIVPEGPVYVVEVQVRGRSGSRVVDVYLDSDEGLDVGRLARYSREIGFLLEAGDVIEGAYRLNVSSPGAERPLRMPRQFTKHVGRTLEVRRGEEEPLRGVLQAADAEFLTLRLEDSDLRMAFNEIGEARVVLPW